MLAFLAVKISGLHQFALARFRFFWGRCLFFHFAFANIYAYHTTRLLLPPHSFPLSSLTTQTIPDNFLSFLAVIRHYKNTSCSPTLGAFCRVFASPFAPASICTHRIRSIPIYTHFKDFLSNYQKHDVRGNFPGHRAQIVCCTTIFPCFRARPCPYTTSHPSGPIRTHLHPSVTSHTLNFNRYM